MCLRKRGKNPQQGYDLKDESVPSGDPSTVGSNFIRHLSGRVIVKKPSLRNGDRETKKGLGMPKYTRTKLKIIGNWNYGSINPNLTL